MNAAIIAKSAKALALTTGGLIATASLAAAAAPAPTTTPSIVETASYSITYTCTGGAGCAMGVGYKHSYSIDVDTTGSLKGTGSQDGYPQITESLGGALVYAGTTRTQSMNFVSTYTGYLAGYAVTENGSVDPVSGALSGTASSGMPGITDATFSVSGVRTSLTIVPVVPVVPTVGGGSGGGNSGGTGDKDDVKKVNPPVHKPGDTDKNVKPKPAKPADPKPAKPADKEKDHGQTKDKGDQHAGDHESHGSD